MSKNVVTLKWGSKVTHGHWEWYHSIVYGFLLVIFSNFVTKMHCFLIFDFKKCRDLENRVRGPSRSSEMSPLNRAHMTSYWHSIVTMALSRVVSEIFNVEKCSDLETRVRGHSRSSKIIKSGTHDFLLTFYSNHRLISHRFRDKRRFPSKIAYNRQFFPPLCI